jgi:hypothetical protein
MKNLIIIALIFSTTFISAQEIKLPNDVKEALGEDIKSDKNTDGKNDDVGPSDHTETFYDADVFLANVWLVRVEYVLQYEDQGVTNSLAKGENDYFGYSTTYGVAGDKYIWVDTEQLKPWETDPEYGMYRADSLTPVTTNVLVSKVGESDFQTVTEAEKGITLIDNNLAAFNLPAKNSAFRVKIDPSEDTPWLFLMGENKSFSADKYELEFVGLAKADSKSVDAVLKAKKKEGKEFEQGVILYSTKEGRNYSLSDYVYISNNRARLSKVKYKNELKVVKTEGKSSKCSYCCDDIEKVTDKDEHKKIIKKWEEQVEKAKNELKYEEDKARMNALKKQINECELKIEEYKKGFLGINFLK